MTELNYLAVGVAAVAAFVLSGVWYSLLGDRLARLSPAYADNARSQAWTAVVEIARNLVLALVFSGLLTWIGIGGAGEAVLLAVVLWVAFPVVLLLGSIFHENVPPKLAAIHVGDWLAKLIVIAVILGVWR